LPERREAAQLRAPQHARLNSWFIAAAFLSPFSFRHADAAEANIISLAAAFADFHFLRYFFVSFHFDFRAAFFHFLGDSFFFATPDFSAYFIPLFLSFSR